MAAGGGWVRDATVESTPLDTTGGHTWRAAYRLAEYLEAAAADLGLGSPGVRVLELGSGTGWLGVTVARNLPAAALVCLTEQAGGLGWLRHNVARNAAAGLPLDHVRVQPCDWLQFARGGGADGESPAARAAGGQPAKGLSAPAGLVTPGAGGPAAATAGGAAAGAAASSSNGGGSSGESGAGGQQDLDLASIQWDFILGSDLIYNQVGSRCLPRVLAALARPSTTVALYCHTKHRYDLLDLEFFQELAAAGLECEEVSEPGAPPPPDSPPLQFPPLDLFPEQRIAVYRITKAAGAALKTPAADGCGG